MRKTKETNGIEIDAPVSTEERLNLYKKYYDEIQGKKVKGRIDVSIEQFTEAVKLQAKWDNSYGEKYEKLTKRIHSREEIDNWFRKSESAFKKLLKAYGIKVCKAKSCIKEIPVGSNPRQEYCSDEKCRNRARQKKWRNKNPDKKALSNIKTYTKKGLKQAGVSADTIEKFNNKIQ